VRAKNRGEKPSGYSRSDGASRRQFSAATPAGRIQTLSGDPSFMTSFARGLAVIQAFSACGARPTIAGLSAQTGLPRPAVHRCLYTLRQLGFVETGEGGLWPRLSSQLMTASRKPHTGDNSCAKK